MNSVTNEASSFEQRALKALYDALVARRTNGSVSPSQLWREVQLLRQMGRMHEAQRFCVELLEADPTHEDAHRFIAILNGTTTAYPRPERSGIPAFLRIENFLGAKDHASVTAEMVRVSRLGTGAQQAVMGSRENPSGETRLYVDIETRDAIQYPFPDTTRSTIVAAMTNMRERIFQTIGMGDVVAEPREVHWVLQKEGGLLIIHRDDCGEALSMATGNGRVASSLYYAHPMPGSFSGGGLRLYDWGDDPHSPGDPYTRIMPTDNSMLAFPACAWHQVEPLSSVSPEPAAGRWAVVVWWHRV